MADAPTDAQKEYVLKHCETHDPQLLASDTGLSLEAATALREAALAETRSNQFADLTKVRDGVFVMDARVSNRVDDFAKTTNNDVQLPYIHRIK